MALDPSQIEALVDQIAERVIHKIAAFADDDGIADDPMAGPPPGDLGDEQMAAGVGPAFLPGMAGGGAEGDDDGMDAEADRFADDDFGDDGDEDFGGDDGPPPGDDLPPEGGDGDEGEAEGDDELPPEEGDGDEGEGDSDEEGDEPERYSCDGNRGNGMSQTKKTKYQAGADDAVALERYSADGVDLVRYQKRVATLEAESTRKSSEIGKLRKDLAGAVKKLERYAAGYDGLVAELRKRDRADALTSLAMEGYELDVAEELKRAERYSAEQFNEHLGVIRERYRFTPADDDFIPTRDPDRGALDADADDASINPMEVARYAKTIAQDLAGLSPEDRATTVLQRYQAHRKAVRQGARD